MRVNHKKLFVDEYVVLDGTITVRCKFDGCIVELNENKDVPFPNAVVTDNQFIDCLMVGDGWATSLLKE